ncbi:IdeS/Mac family cysteine endopeptidase [Streptococcus hillyeri]|nr:IdeS/Mac family cysteine endopeptidase [Streptococcus hillyeri]
MKQENTTHRVKMIKRKKVWVSVGTTLLSLMLVGGMLAPTVVRADQTVETKTAIENVMTTADETVAVPNGQTESSIVSPTTTENILELKSLADSEGTEQVQTEVADDQQQLDVEVASEVPTTIAEGIGTSEEEVVEETLQSSPTEETSSTTQTDNERLVWAEATDADTSELGKEQKKSEITETLWVKGVHINRDQFKEIQTENSDKKVTSKYFAADYDAGSGYYDANKSLNHDEKLCSGAVASNMFHWWVEQNKESINEYLKQDDKNGTFTINNQTFTSRDLYKYDRDTDQSGLFDYIRTKFTNTTLIPERLVNLFLNGYPYNNNRSYINWSERTLETPSTVNLFNKVLGDKVTVAVETFKKGQWDLKHFSSKIREYIKDNKALGISYGIGETGMGHIVSLWGADFDKDGLVKAIYITDSNDKEVKLDGGKKVGMIRYDVNADSENTIRLSTHKNIEGQGPNTTGVLGWDLYSMSNNKKEWEEYFKQHPKQDRETKRSLDATEEKARPQVRSRRSVSSYAHKNEIENLLSPITQHYTNLKDAKERVVRKDIQSITDLINTQYPGSNRLAREDESLIDLEKLDEYDEKIPNEQLRYNYKEALIRYYENSVYEHMILKIADAARNNSEKIKRDYKVQLDTLRFKESKKK